MGEIYTKLNEEIPTHFVNLAIGKCEDSKEFENLLIDIKDQDKAWSDYIGKYITAKGLSVKYIAEGCNISESTAKRILKSVPSRRENVIKLACMLAFDSQQTDYLLTHRAKFQKLYSKNAEDIIWLYIIDNGGSMNPAREYEELKNMYLNFSEYAVNDISQDIEHAEMSTDYIKNILISQPEKEKFIYYMQYFIPVFENGYKKLSEHINLLFESKGVSANTLFADKPNFLKLHYTQTEKLKCHECPSRTYLLALGLHLGLSVDGINELLEKAGMGPISGKDKLEATIYYFLEEINIMNPDALFDPESSKPITDNTSKVYEFANTDTFFNGSLLDEDTIAEYIRNKLTEMNIKLEQKITFSKILELL